MNEELKQRYAAALHRAIDNTLGTETSSDEPVAWMSQGGDVSRNKDYFEEMGFKDLIPLYTHPAKTLTDEEIQEIGREHLEVEFFDEGEYGMEYNIYGMVGFAKAILRKAQEK